MQRLNDEDVQVGGDEPALTRGVVGFAAGPADLAIAMEDDKKFEARFVGGAVAEAGIFGALCCEIRARSQESTRAALRGQCDARNLFYDFAVEVGDGERFFEVKFAGLAGRINAAVIVNAVGEVRVLLHFEDDHVCADGVWSFRRDEKCIAWLRRVPLE